MAREQAQIRSSALVSVGPSPVALSANASARAQPSWIHVTSTTFPRRRQPRGPRQEPARRRAVAEPDRRAREPDVRLATSHGGKSPRVASRRSASAASWRACAISPRWAATTAEIATRARARPARSAGSRRPSRARCAASSQSSSSTASSASCAWAAAAMTGLCTPARPAASRERGGGLALAAEMVATPSISSASACHGLSWRREFARARRVRLGDDEPGRSQAGAQERDGRVAAGERVVFEQTLGRLRGRAGGAAAVTRWCAAPVRRQRRRLRGAHSRIGASHSPICAPRPTAAAAVHPPTRSRPRAARRGRPWRARSRRVARARLRTTELRGGAAGACDPARSPRARSAASARAADSGGGPSRCGQTARRDAGRGQPHQHRAGAGLPRIASQAGRSSGVRIVVGAGRYARRG